MSFPRYQKYKHSGVEWLGEVPEHWEIKKLKYVSPELTVGIVVEPSKLYAEDGVPALRSLNVKAGAIVLDNLVFITQAAHELHSKSRLRAGDVVAVRTGQPGTAAVIPQELDGCNCIDLIVIRKPTVGSERFLCWYLGSDAALAQFSVGSGGAIQQHFNISSAAELIVAAPPPADQFRIAAFLDAETAKIDALVTEQQRLIELLNEKRQAVITHAVTRGLNPNAPMKETGIEWLGQVPTHWSAVRVGKVCRSIADGPHFSPSYVDEGIPFLSARNIKVDRWELEDVKYVSEADCALFDQRVVPQQGDVLYTKGGTTGVARAVDLNFRFQVWVHVAVLKLRPELVSAEFLAYALNSIGCYEQSQLLTRGATNNDLGLTRIVKIWMALPPLEEQRKIVEYLSRECGQLDALIAEATSAIALLEERRAALISAAVAGQIDVRGVAERTAA